MLSQLSKKNIKKKLREIYSFDNSKKNLNIYSDEIYRVINEYNKFGKKGKIYENGQNLPKMTKFAKKAKFAK